MTTLAIAAAIVLLVLPLVVFRGRLLLRWYAFELLSHPLAALLWRHVATTVDPYLAVVAFFVVKLAIFSIVLACARDVRWSANRAALLAALVYALMVPAMLRTPIDGDEPFYLLLTESLVHDRDVDLRNQYATVERSRTGRTDLAPQPYDPVGPNGEQYSRHEPFLPLLMIPGYLAGGLLGAIATIALFGTLLVRSTMRWLEDEGIDESTIRAVFPFFAFAPPVVFYAARIWPEVPAAFCFVEALRGVRHHRPQRWIPALFALVMLKLRFVLIGVVLMAVVLRRHARRMAIAAAILAVPIVVIWFVTGRATGAHLTRELLPLIHPRHWAMGILGLPLDGMAGIAFRAPFYLLGLCALVRWRSMPDGFRLGILASTLYLLYLVPRIEWHGGWSPPLRYIVVFMPVLTLGAAAIWPHVSKGVVALLAIWTTALVAHGVAFPYRLFHIFDGQNPLGEWLSYLHRVDFGRLFPSLIRFNVAAIVGALVLVALLVVSRLRIAVPPPLVVAIAALLFAGAFRYAQTPSARIEFEDAYVVKTGGKLWPEEFTVARWRFSGGWEMHAGESVSFPARGGRATLRYMTWEPTMLELAGRGYTLPATGDGKYAEVSVEIPRGGRVELRCLSGAINLDRMTR